MACAAAGRRSDVAARARAGIESGNLEYAAYALVNLVNLRMLLGTELNHVLVEAESAIRFYQRTHHFSGIPVVQPFSRQLDVWAD